MFRMADNLAAHGYLVIVPDQFSGDAVNPVVSERPPGFVLSEWLKEHGPDVVQPIIDRVYDAIKSEFGNGNS